MKHKDMAGEKRIRGEGKGKRERDDTRGAG